MDLIRFAIVHDWAVLLPIVLCSVLLLAVACERWWFYRQNRRNIADFIPVLQRELGRGLEYGRAASSNLGGLLGQVSEEGILTMARHRGDFERSFDITVSLAVRSLERNLSVLGTIATVSPYLGLFGTVVRILLTFGEMSREGAAASAAPQIMYGIGSALIATAFGLAVAIMAVFLNNYYHSIVGRYEEDFQLLKLVFLGETESRVRAAVPPNPPGGRPVTEPRNRI